jgi:hypothetical protein
MICQAGWVEGEGGGGGEEASGIDALAVGVVSPCCGID